MGSWGESRYFYGLDDNQIDVFVQGIGFRSVCKGHAKWLETGKNKFLYINAGEFGLNRGSTKIGQGRRPDEKVCAELKKWLKKATVMFILLGYDNCHAGSVNGRFRHGDPTPTNLRNWEGHAGLMVITGVDWGDWTYYDGQLYKGVARYKHWAWRAVSEILRHTIRRALELPRAPIKVNMFGNRVNVEHACTAPILFVVEAMINERNTDPYLTPSVLPKFLNRLCDVLEAMGHTDMCGTVPWENVPTA